FLRTHARPPARALRGKPESRALPLRAALPPVRFRLWGRRRCLLRGRHHGAHHRAVAFSWPQGLLLVKRIFHTLRVLALALGAVIMAYPFASMLATAFKPLGEAVAPGFGIWPQTWQPGNFAEVFATAPFGR